MSRRTVLPVLSRGQPERTRWGHQRTIWRCSSAPMRRCTAASAQLGDELPDSRRRGVEGDLLLRRQLDLEDALHPAGAEHDRDTDEQALRPELALEQDGARQDALAIEQDRLDH